jgi:ABC-type phosphate transport system substrate-binding protein
MAMVLQIAGVRIATGNEGMLNTLAGKPYSVGYVGISYRDAIKHAGLGTAALKIRTASFCCRRPRASAPASRRSIRAPRRISD